MPIERRALLTVGAIVVLGGGGAGIWKAMQEQRAPEPAPMPSAPAPAAPPPSAPAAGGDPRMAERGLGRTDAPVTVTEWFSLTCPHCAAFHRDSLPRIKTELIDTGKVRLVFRDFPLDQVALIAAMVARALPPERYEPFISALFASQDRWAFNRQANPVEELAKLAALAGMSRETFNGVVNDQAFKAAILKGQEEADKTYKVDSTPSFIFNGPKARNRKEAGGRTPDDFAKLVAEAAG